MTFTYMSAPVLLLCVKTELHKLTVLFAAPIGYVCNYSCCKIAPHVWTAWGAGTQKDGIEKKYSTGMRMRNTKGA